MPFGFLDTWRDNLVKASFRGVPFSVIRSNSEFGKRAKIYETSWKDGKKFTDTKEFHVFAQDFGVDIDEFSIEGFIIANKDNDYDYFQNRDDLISALKAKGEGTLKHPYYGEMKVLLKERAKVEEAFNEGGMARFSMIFVQYQKSIFPSTQFVDHIGYVDASILDMINGYLDAFISTFNAVGSFITSTINDIGNLINKISTVVNAISFGLTAIVNGIVNGVLNIVNGLSALLNAPCDLAQAFFDAADSLQNLVGMVKDVEFGGVLGGCSGEQQGDTTTLTGDSIPASLGESTVNALLDNIGFDETELSTTTAEQTENQSLSVDMMKGAMFANIARIAIRIDFDSVEAANLLRDLIADAMDAYLLRLGGIDYAYATSLYLQMGNVRNIFVESITKKNQDIAREIDYRVPPDTQTVLEVAYDKYEDITRATEIFNRNTPTVRHPGFLPNGDNINLLSE